MKPKPKKDAFERWLEQKIKATNTEYEYGTKNDFGRGALTAANLILGQYRAFKRGDKNEKT